MHRRDQAHPRAAATWTTLRAGQRPLVTTGLVAAECHTLLLHRLGAAAAVSFLNGLFARPHQRIAWPDADLVLEARDRWLRRFADQSITLTDAVSFEVMRQEGIREAFTFDEDFRRAGFGVL